LNLLSNLQSLNKKLPGSNGYKKELRNEIRALINCLGAPAFFITLNPSDVNNPLVRLLCGAEIDLEDSSRGEDMTRYFRQKLAADHPKETATFFHRIMQAFIRNVVRYNRNSPGLFGRCTGYYGMVEAQGKGTLHCHFLIWVDGHLSPQKLRDKMVKDGAFKSRLFTFLEALIKSELPGATEVVKEQEGVILAAPKRPQGVPNPAAVALPQCADMNEEEFQYEFERRVKDLVIENHWHRHNNTCWKYLRRGEPRDDAHCRMRIDGTTRETSELDEDTQAIMIRRLHPRINCYNDVLTFLTQSNNDIKFIGSGEGAKALIYYVTDYITKVSLPTHIGLSALRVAIEKNQKKYEGDELASPDAVSKSLFVKCANGILGRLEISHPQAMSYILGHGDHYTSHKYQKLFLGSFMCAADAYFGTDEAAGPRADEQLDVDLEDDDEGDGDRVDIDAEENDETEGRSNTRFGMESDVDSHVTVLLDADNGIVVNKQIDDYRFRNNQEPFNGCSLYQFVQKFRKVSIKKSNRDRRLPTQENVPQRTPRSRNPNADFLSQHPHSATHRLSATSIEHVPVILGPTIPHPDKGPSSREAWCKSMLILFKPWRSFADLKGRHERWSTAFDRIQFTEEDRIIMQNMVVLHECKDARDTDAVNRSNIPILPRVREYNVATDETERLLIGERSQHRHRRD
jgi:hypothetical protein